MEVLKLFSECIVLLMVKYRPLYHKTFLGMFDLVSKYVICSSVLSHIHFHSPPHLTTFLFPPKSNLLALNFSVKSDVAALFLTTSLKTSFFQLNERTSSSQAVYPTMQSQSLPLSVCPSICLCLLSTIYSGI